MVRKHKSLFLGNKATILGIVIIALMFFIMRSSDPIVSIDDKKIPEKIVYDQQEYSYKEAIKSSPFYFVKAKVGSDEGYRVLLMRKDKRAEKPENIYIYIAKKVYLKYQIP